MRSIILKNNKLNKGFTLLETLVAVAIFTVSVLALLSVLSGGIASTNYAKRKIMATYLAQQGVEYIRNQRDNYVILNSDNPQAGWDDFTAAVTGYTYPITDPLFSGFTRTVLAEFPSVDEVKISSTVSWNQGFGNQSFTFSENLFNWSE